MRRIIDRAVGDGRDKTQCPLGADHQVLQDIDRIFEVDQCVKTIAVGVSDLELVANAFGEHCVGARLTCQAIEPVKQPAVAPLESAATALITRIEHRAIRENYACAGERVVTVLR